MADDMGVKFSVGFLEGWIDTAESMGVNHADTARVHLQIVNDAYDEYRHTINHYKDLIQKLKYQLEGAR